MIVTYLIRTQFLGWRKGRFRKENRILVTSNEPLGSYIIRAKIKKGISLDFTEKILISKYHMFVEGICSSFY